MFCPNNSFSDLWIADQMSECFLETLVAGVLAVFMVLFGTLQLSVYTKYSIPVPFDVNLQPRLYKVQLIITFLIPLMEILKFVVDTYLFQMGIIFDFQVVYMLVMVFVFLLSAKLIVLEINYNIPPIPAHRHGLVLIIFWILVFGSKHLVFIMVNTDDVWLPLQNIKGRIQFAMFIVNYILCFFLLVLGLKAPGLTISRYYFNLYNESQLYFDSIGQEVSTPNILQKLKKLVPFLWPKKKMNLQLRIVVCILLIIVDRVANVYAPIYSAKIVDSLLSDPILFQQDFIFILISIKLIQGDLGMGLLNSFSNFLWIRVQQYTKREIQVYLFNHLHNLSLKWHSCKKVDEILKMIDFGTSTVSHMLSLVLFDIIPAIIDIIVAVIFFSLYFDWIMGIFILFTIALYIVLTITITEWKTKFFYQMDIAHNNIEIHSFESMQNIEAVKYYNTEKYEVQTHEEKIIAFQNEEFKSRLSLIILNAAQNIVLSLGLLAGSLYTINFVTDFKEYTVGDYVLFTLYIIQLYKPINCLGALYKAIQKNWSDIDIIFDLIDIESHVKDIHDAKDLVLKNGQIEFNCVSFSYQSSRLFLRNISFLVSPGNTLAIVGPPGSGKSTILKLLLRFYKPASGIIKIDDQNIMNVTQKSLRNIVSGVPQNTALFNKSIKFNLSYGKIDATDEEIMEAAKISELHDRIMKYPNSYNTRVGVKGLQLTKREKQQVAITRALLKKPKIVLLDEVTSVLEKQTEKRLHWKLWNHVCAKHTTIIVTNKLTEVTRADEILVMRHGEICERGRHNDLLYRDGFYADMWSNYLKSIHDLSSDNKPNTSRKLSDQKFS